jgi:hypothetical protein
MQRFIQRFPATRKAAGGDLDDSLASLIQEERSSPPTAWLSRLIIKVNEDCRGACTIPEIVTTGTLSNVPPER